MSMFSGASFPITGALKLLFWLAAIGVLALAAGGFGLAWWLIDHVRFV